MKFFKFLQNKVTIPVWGILSLVIIGVVVFFVVKNSRRESIVANPNQVLVPVVVNKDKNGDNHAQLPSLAVSDFGKIGDSLKKVIKDKNIKIQELTTLTQRTDTIFKKVPVYLDTNTRNLSFEKKDNYIDVTGTIDTKTGTADIGLISLDTVTYTLYTKHRFLGSTTTMVDFKNTSPYNYTTFGNSLHLVQRTPIIVVGPSIGLMFDGVKTSAFYGIGATFNLFSIKTRK